MESKWIETVTDVTTMNWRGELIHLTGVRALKNAKTGKIRVYPYDVAKAEVSNIAERINILPRDLGTLLILYAKPGNFKEGDVLYKYHLQKILFYLWKELEKKYAGSFPRDEFIAAENGPVPKSLKEDLERLEKEGLVKTRSERWIDHTSKRIILTEEGLRVAKELWESVPTPYIEEALRVKERIYPLDPETVRHLVHREYPEYRETYIKNDIE